MSHLATLPGTESRRRDQRRLGRFRLLPGLLLTVGVLMMNGCSSPPIGASLVGPKGSQGQVEKSAVTSGELSANTLSLLHRYDLDRRAASDPGAILSKIYATAVATGDRDLLFVLAELSYLAGEHSRIQGPATNPGAAHQYYLGAAVYAYLFLFGDAHGDRPNGYDRRFRTACAIYNYGLGMALTKSGEDSAIVQLADETRALPVGGITIKLDASALGVPLGQIDKFLVADHFHVRGLSVRNREAGLGAPLIGAGWEDENLRLRRSLPLSAFLRIDATLAGLESGAATAVLELHSIYGKAQVTVGDQSVPLEKDLTTAQAYTLNQEYAWKAERTLFFHPAKAVKSQLIMGEPYQPGRIPLLLVHGTFSSPVWWAEMTNTLNADPILRARYQIWFFLYSTGKPIGNSANELRTMLTDKLAELDPAGTDAGLRQVVVIGHSQGGLLTKLTATDTGDTLWRLMNEQGAYELPVDETERLRLKNLVALKPLPSVRRVVFISTPHRGSYRVGGLVRNLGRWLIELPQTAVNKTSGIVAPTEAATMPTNSFRLFQNSLEGMAPDNPYLLALADLPVAPGIKSHSIIAVEGDSDYHKGKDGVVAYQSAHLEGVDSEYIVRGGHSCQSLPPTIEEVRRILHEHLAAIDQ
jgi:pimeloyl-ACP methyl ester carboxylesterase